MSPEVTSALASYPAAALEPKREQRLNRYTIIGWPVRAVLAFSCRIINHALDDLR